MSKANKGIFLDVQGGKAYNKCNVEVYKRNDSACQKWIFEPVLNGSKTLSNGVYQIQSSLGSKYRLDIEGGKSNNGANAFLYENSTQTFTVTYLNNGFYKIEANCSGKVLDVANSDGRAARMPLANVTQYTSNGGSHQQWLIKSAGNGYYYVISKISGLYLDVQGGKAYNKCNVDVFPGHGSGNQKWKFVKIGASSQPSIKASTTLSKIKVSWGASSGANGYQIQISKNSNFKSTVVNMTTSSCSYAYKSKKGTKYYVRVRSYKLCGIKKLYSSWSRTSSLKSK